MSLVSNKECSLCKHHNAMLATLRRDPFLGAVPCLSCTRFPDQRTDKFEYADRYHVNKMYNATE